MIFHLTILTLIICICKAAITYKKSWGKKPFSWWRLGTVYIYYLILGDFRKVFFCSGSKKKFFVLTHHGKSGFINYIPFFNSFFRNTDQFVWAFSCAIWMHYSTLATPRNLKQFANDKFIFLGLKIWKDKLKHFLLCIINRQVVTKSTFNYLKLIIAFCIQPCSSNVKKSGLKKWNMCQKWSPMIRDYSYLNINAATLYIPEGRQLLAV